MSTHLPSYEEAAALVATHAEKIRQHHLRSERIALANATGRILAAPIQADDDQPPFARSTRDGYACRAAEASSSTTLPVAGASHAGETPSCPLPPVSAWEIMTGAPVPEGADCVVMMEHVEKLDGGIRLMPSRNIGPGDNVVAKGAQARRGDEQLAAGTTLAPAQIALAASCGYAQLEVYIRPRVAILTTGDELVPVDAIPGPGKIRNSNAPMLAALVANAGGEPVILPTAADTSESLGSALAQALESDMLLISGGVSAGKFDLVEPALARLGGSFHFTGVRIQPGKPLVYAEIPRGGGSPTAQVFGLPGNPISSAATFHLFAAPILAALAGSKEIHPRFVLAHLSRDTDRKIKPGLTRFLPAYCEFSSSINRLPHVCLVPWQGSGDLTAFGRSNCYLVIPEDAGFLAAGTTVRILLH
jgi:molybdopterin molybdotransferase